MFLGIDCGTQGTKVLLWDAGRQKVLATSFRAHHLSGDREGQKEQNPAEWLFAMQSCIREVVTIARIDPKKITGIGVSGQQHSLVILDKFDQVIRPAKLWCDTEGEDLLTRFCQEYQSTQGQSLSSAIGIHVPMAFTLGKLLWVKEHEAMNFNRIDKVMLPHDYLNFFLSGEYKAEYGDASGTGYFDTRGRCWCLSVTELLAKGFVQKLPQLIEAHEPHGYLTDAAADFLGLQAGIVIASGGGDNMMSAIGTANITAGQLTMSLGTSGTLSTCLSAQLECDGFEDINAFCSSTGDWLPLISTMNLTSAINAYREVMGIGINDFDNLLRMSQPGAAGLWSFPWLNGARLPNLPGIRGEISGMTTANFTRHHMLRSVVEGVTFNLCKGIDIFRARGLTFNHISIIGGGANSLAWCQMIADITGLPVSRPGIADAAALGAAIQANWCHHIVSAGGKFTAISSVMPQQLTQRLEESIEPDPATYALYQPIYQEYHAEVEIRKQRYLN